MSEKLAYVVLGALILAGGLALWMRYRGAPMAGVLDPTSPAARAAATAPKVALTPVQRAALGPTAPLTVAVPQLPDATTYGVQSAFSSRFRRYS